MKKAFRRVSLFAQAVDAAPKSKTWVAADSHRGDAPDDLAELYAALRRWTRQRAYNSLPDAPDETETSFEARAAELLALPQGQWRVHLDAYVAVTHLFATRYLLEHREDDHKRTMALGERVMAISPERSTQIEVLVDMGLAQGSSFGVTGEKSSIDAAISLTRQARGLMRDDHAELGETLLRLARWHALRYTRFSEPKDIHSGLDCYRVLGKLATDESKVLPAEARSIHAFLLMSRYILDGKKQKRDIDTAVVLQRTAVGKSEPPKPTSPPDDKGKQKAAPLKQSPSFPRARDLLGKAPAPNVSAAHAPEDITPIIRKVNERYDRRDALRGPPSVLRNTSAPEAERSPDRSREPAIREQRSGHGRTEPKRFAQTGDRDERSPRPSYESRSSADPAPRSRIDIERRHGPIISPATQASFDETPDLVEPPPLAAVRQILERVAPPATEPARSVSCTAALLRFFSREAKRWGWSTPFKAQFRGQIQQIALAIRWFVDDLANVLILRGHIDRFVYGMVDEEKPLKRAVFLMGFIDDHADNDQFVADWEKELRKYTALRYLLMDA